MVTETEKGLQVSAEEVAAWSRRLVITVPADRVRSTRARVARALAKRVRIPGFRKGRIPPKHLEARFGEEIDRETRQEAVQEAFQEAIEDLDLKPIDQPRVTNVSYSPDTELTFEVAFDIWPEITLGRVGGFRLERPKVDVDDEAVQEQIQRLRRQNAMWRAVERHPTAGDWVSVEITPLDEEVAGEEAGETRPHRFVLGEGRAIEDVENAIMSLEPGGSDEFTVTFPEDASDEALQGKSQRLGIALQEVRESELPELDDSFASEVGEFESLSDLEAAIREDLERQESDEAEHQLEHQLMDQIIEANPFEIPDSWVEAETERYIRAVLGSAEGADEEAIRGIREQARRAAVRGIKRMLVVRTLAEREGLEVKREEVDERVKAIAERAGRPAREVRSQLAKSGELDRLRERLTERKVFDYLKEQSEIVTRGD